MSSKSKQSETITFPQRYRIVSADLSLKRPGFCKFDCEMTENGLRIFNLAVTSVDNKNKSKPHGQLLDETLKEISTFFPDPEKDLIPTFYLREKAFNARAAQSEMGIYKVVGVTDWFLYRLGFTWHEIFPVTVKKYVTGSGKAEKEKVAECLKLYIGDFEFSNDDESDSVAVGIAWLIQNGQLKSKVEEKEDGKKDVSV